MKAGFAEVDITPPLGTLKIGWIKRIVSAEVHDPLFARISVFESGGNQLAFVQLDTLSVRWTMACDIRSRIEQKYGFPGDAVMVSATHNHAGPAIAWCGEVPRDDAFVETLTGKVVEAFGCALADLGPARIGFASVLEWDVSSNRRYLMRDGTTSTHGNMADPKILCCEGPIDPEVAVVAAVREDGTPAGCMVNFAAHPTDFGGGGVLSAGYPGVVARCMQQRGWPVALFLNGASGNIRTSTALGGQLTMEDVGTRLAEDVVRALENMTFRDNVALGSARETIDLPYRTVTEDEITGSVRGAQRFIDPALYDKAIPDVVDRIATRKVQPAEVQALFMDEYAFVGIPAEYFVEHGLRIKEESFPLHALVVAQANGMVGYLPTRKAFERGGYETTFLGSSRMAPDAGDILTDCAIRVIGSEKETRQPGDR